MLRFVLHSWFLIVLALALGLGIAFSGALSPFAESLPKGAVIAAVMLATSLSLNFRRLSTGKGNWTAVALAVLINVCVAPPLGWLLGRLLPAPLAAGLVVAMSVPCTIATAIVWTRRGNGNDTATAMVTLITNFGCFLVLPFWTGTLLGETAGVAPGALMQKLLVWVAAPMVVAQLLRNFAKVAAWADRVKPKLSLGAQWGVLLMALLGAIGAGKAMRADAAQPSQAEWAMLVAVIVVLHALLLFAGWAAGLAARLDPPERLALLIAGSQKTMAVGLGVSLYFGPMALFPLVAYHFTQLVVDAAIVDWWKQSRRTP